MILFGDIHGEHEVNKFTKIYKANKELFQNNPKYHIIHFLGDWGLLWNWPAVKSEIYWIRYFMSKPNLILITPGNHDNWKFIFSLPLVPLFGGLVYRLADNIYFTKRGEVYEIEGNKIWCFGGAESIDKDGRIEDKSWWPEEIASYQEMQYGVDQLDKHNWKVDYVLTHTFPKTIIETMFYDGKAADPMASYFDFILNQKLQFKTWYCGHFHRDQNIHCKFQILYDTIGII